MSQRDTAVAFLRHIGAGRIRQAFELQVAPHFKHHNPFSKGDGKSLAAGMEENEARFPGKILEIQRVVEEGTLVVVHSRLKLPQGAGELALVHIFRFEGKRIAELWDIAQPVPAESPNENGMF
jgi:predicted SnoaL-like aldol condensation-catalyzing enzyme